jgi:hypothetical protein
MAPAHNLRGGAGILSITNCHANRAGTLDEINQRDFLMAAFAANSCKRVT